MLGWASRRPIFIFLWIRIGRQELRSLFLLQENIILSVVIISGHSILKPHWHVWKVLNIFSNYHCQQIKHIQVIGICSLQSHIWTDILNFREHLAYDLWQIIIWMEPIYWNRSIYSVCSICIHPITSPSLPIRLPTDWHWYTRTPTGIICVW